MKKKVAVLTEDKAFTLFVSSPHRKIWQLKSPHPREFAIQDKKNAVARGSAGGGGWAQVELAPYETTRAAATAASKGNEFLYISLPPQHDYDVKWPYFKFFCGRKRQGDKFYHLCPNSGVATSLQLQHKFPSFK